MSTHPDPSIKYLETPTEKKHSTYILELVLTILITAGLFALAAIPHLEHSLAFIFPVPLALFIIHNKIRDGIFPAIFLIICGTLITHYLPVGNSNWIRGLLIMMASVFIGFLHGTFYKTKIKHLYEILILMAVELSFGILMTVIFYVAKDPVFAFDHEFHHYFANIVNLLNLDKTTIYMQNVAVIFEYMVIPFTIALAIVEVLFTHIIIYLFLKHLFKAPVHRPFTGLAFNLPKISGYIFLGFVLASVISLFIITTTISETLLGVIIAIIIITLSFITPFMLQGLLVAIYFARIKKNFELSILLLLFVLLFAVPFAILGALNVIFKWSDKLIKSEETTPIAA